MRKLPWVLAIVFACFAVLPSFRNHASYQFRAAGSVLYRCDAVSGNVAYVNTFHECTPVLPIERSNGVPGWLAWDSPAVLILGFGGAAAVCCFLAVLITRRLKRERETLTEKKIK